MTRQDTVSLLYARVAAIQRRDLDALMQLHADSCVVESPLGGHATGHEAIRRVYDAWFSAFPDAEFTFEQPIVEGERAVQTATMVGTDTGGFMGLPPSEKRFTLPMVFLFTIRDGRIQHERRVYDFTGLLLQLGVLKAKPA
jgi:steroid delta-isomerase-like uncharacterized protein